MQCIKAKHEVVKTIIGEIDYLYVEMMTCYISGNAFLFHT